MAEVSLSGSQGNPVDISAILQQIVPIISTMMNLMLTFYVLKMMMGMVGTVIPRA